MINLDVRGPNNELLSQFPVLKTPSDEEIKKIQEDFAQKSELSKEEITVAPSAEVLEDKPLNILSVFTSDGVFIMQNYTEEDSVNEKLLQDYKDNYGPEIYLEITSIDKPYIQEIDEEENK